MQLNYQIVGQGSPLIIIHGLFGTLENWGSQIKSLAEHYQVIAVDLRNHGRSPHSDEMNYPVMTDDIVELMERLSISKANIIGHSMGGKVAMQLALNAPERIEKLVVVDIAPVQYPPHHDDVFSGLFAIDLTQINSRRDADQVLSEHIKSPAVRSFLLKNLYRDEKKQFAWRMNLSALHQQYSSISLAPQGTPYQQEMLFIKGETSDYLIPEYREQVLNLFPKANYRIIKGAGHWPHAEKPEHFTQLALNYLAKE